MNGEKLKEKFFVKEEFIEWWAESFAQALKRYTAEIEWLERREIKLDTAKDAFPVDKIPPEGFDSGSYIKVVSLDGEATLRLDTLGSQEFDLTAVTEFKQLFSQVFITNTAQPGKKLILVLGRGDFSFPESPEKKEKKTLIASTTTPLKAGGNYTSNWFDVLNYSRVTLLAYSDQASADNGAEIQQSIDGKNSRHSTQNTAPANTGLPVTVELIARYVRVKYTNGGIDQDIFELVALARSMP